ncbi:DNA repair protein RadA [Arsenicicoccus dermatophilus]|uniref:DNA repair protein RadA n=1 Tax=Arsenicicoccus dermatophilus TaxID=1076331 RepID=UPI001F4C7127|nr:DNA repair protein RadA [Arsenicicoccus dermatophilus]MCH8613894.1 DNA repair protein RadA [Arsenicicoccus dermatophilus]
MASKTPKATYRCSECGWTTPKWVGRCGECQTWGSVSEVGAVAIRTTAASHVERPAVPIGQVDARRAEARSTGVGEFDRVLGGGLVAGAVVLVAGEPGIGKSTLLLDVAAQVAQAGGTVLYVSGEESAAQVRVRAERIGAIADRLYLASETDLATLLGQVEAVQPDLLVVDSVQTISSGEIEGAAGNVSQVREVAASVIAAAKRRDMATLLVGHVTKDGSIAGPRVLEHLVDVVVQFEGERHSRLRLVRAVKNRYGPTDEVGCFDLSDVGIVGLADPSGLFLSSRDTEVAGTCVTVTLEGRRPLVAEVQALLDQTKATNPRRTTSGVDHNRTAMVLAVLSKHARLAVHECDAYLATVGGVRLTEPAADLAVAIALASSLAGTPVTSGTVAFGEVGLAGEVRACTGLQRRLIEAARLGFRRAIVPTGTTAQGQLPAGIQVLEVNQVGRAIGLALDLGPRTGDARDRV